MAHRFLQALIGHDDVVIATHVRPDGDAIGSQLALGLYLEELGKEVTMINEHPVPENLDWMSGADRIQVFDGSLAQRTTIANAGAVVLVDCNDGSRVGDLLSGAVRSSVAVKFLIDHHTHPGNWFDHVYLREDAAATVELVYELIAGNHPTSIKGAISMALYVGLVTDTGGFRFDTVTPKVHRMAADLLEYGTINPSTVHRAVYETRSVAWVRLLSRALGSMQRCNSGRVGYMALSRGMFGEHGATREDAEGFVNYPLSIKGVEVALLFTETAKGTKVSFRSKGSQHVNHWARSLGGGGHQNAAGVFLRCPLGDAKDQVLSKADRYLEIAPQRSEPPLNDEDGAFLSMLVQAAH